MLGGHGGLGFVLFVHVRQVGRGNEVTCSGTWQGSELPIIVLGSQPIIHTPVSVSVIQLGLYQLTLATDKASWH